MSIEAVVWALHVPVRGNEKIMLIGLANHAHPDGTNAFPSLNRLAVYGCCDRSTARRNIRALVEAGWISEDGMGPNGEKKYRLHLSRGGGEMPPVANRDGGGGKTHPEGVAAAPPEPSMEPSENRHTPATRESAADSIPEGFPDDLKPHARIVMIKLREVAKHHNAKAVTALAVGNLMAAPQRRHKPWVKAVHDFSAWAVDHPTKDVVSRFRNWIDRCTDLAGVEHLDPAAVPPPRGARAKDAKADEAAAREARRREAEERLFQQMKEEEKGE